METISMSAKERKRLAAMAQVQAGKLSLGQASTQLGISYRQVKRCWRRYQAEGDRGIVHRLRGAKSNRQQAATTSLKGKALARYVESYRDYGPTLAAESLAAEGIVVPVSTLRRWLSQAGLWTRHRRRKEHRRRRDRRACYGELVQMDGSHHDWFEGRRSAAVLMVMIDDATGEVSARFFEEETQAAAFEMMQRYAARYGLPSALYVDRAGIYRSDREPTNEEILAEIQPDTQFGRALRTLGVELILARSPQAKGRVERMNGTLQDRLVKALRQAGISDLAIANQFLEEQFLKPFNAKFRKSPREANDVHRAATEFDLPCVLAVHEERVVQNDWTLRWQNSFLQLGRECDVQPKMCVTIVEPLSGPVRLFVGTRELIYQTTRSEPLRGKERPSRGRPTGSNQGQNPAANHPWRGRRKELAGVPPGS